MNDEPRRARVIALVLLVLGLRVAVAFYLPARMSWPDGRRYERIARALLAGEGYGREKEPPLHPLALTAVYSVFGESVRAARVVWAFLGTVTCLACYYMTKELLDHRAARLTLTICAVYPLTLYTSVLPEYPQGLFSLLLALAVLVAIREARAKTRWPAACLLGCLCGLAALTIPTALAFVALLILWAIVAHARPLRGRAIHATMIMVSCSAVILTWSMWHWSTTGHWYLISAKSGLNFYKGNCELMAKYGDADAEDVLADPPNMPEIDPVYEKYRAVMRQGKRITDPKTRDSFFLQKGLAFIRDNPNDAMYLFARKFMNYWRPYPKTVQDARKGDGRSTSRNIVAAATYLPILGLALVSVIIMREWRRLVLPLYLAIVSQCVAYVLAHSSVRYRSPIDYLLIVLASVAFCRLTSGGSGRGYSGADRESCGSVPAASSSESA